MITFSKLGRHGRIANQMFQIAGVIGLAKKHGFDFGFPYWQNYDQLERFGGGESIDIQSFFKNPLPDSIGLNDVYSPFKPIAWPWGYHDKPLSDWSDLVGHFQSEKYFKHCEDTVKHYFKFKNETPKQTNTVAVHFRGGDYGGDYHPTQTSEYYSKAREFFDNGFKFKLFTDDPERALAVVPFQCELVTGNHSLVDLELMTKCDAHIIANSSFSWWGAWLANSRRVIAPRIWFGSQARGLITKDIYCENWIIL